MSREEKILLIYILLKDVRCNFDDPTTDRVQIAISFCNELGGDYILLADQCRKFLADNAPDGRYFRDDFPYGYLNMEKLHGLPETYFDKSEEFKRYVDALVTFPNMIFHDLLEGGD